MTYILLFLSYKTYKNALLCKFVDINFNKITATITPTLMLSLKSKDNTYPIYFSISFGKGKRKFENSKIRIKKTEWDIKKKQVINHSNAVAYNLYIKNRITTFEKDTVFKQDSELYALLIEKKHNVLLLDFISMAMEKSSLKASMRRGYCSIFKRMNANKNLANLPIVDVSTDTILRVQQEWIAEELSNTTIFGYFQMWAFYMNIAHKQKIITENPFQNEILRKMLIKRNSAERIFLTKKEVDSLIKGYDDLKKKEQLYLGYFLISCFTGLRAGDVISINIPLIFKDRSIALKTQKTGEQLRLPLTEEILKMISSMAKNPYNKYRMKYSYYVMNIKSIAKKLCIKKDVTTHVARHTFAMRLAEMGVSIEVAQQLLGHTDIKTTSIYYKIGNKRINDEMSKFGYS